MILKRRYLNLYDVLRKKAHHNEMPDNIDKFYIDFLSNLIPKSHDHRLIITPNFLSFKIGTLYQ